MNENAKKWVAALRDPDAKQTKMHLEDRTGNCCLGIACRIFAAENPDWLINDSGFDDVVVFGEQNHAAALPYEVTEWLGLQDGHGTFGKKKSQALTQMNDEGKSFSQIADLIESEPEGLFA